jgi:hypothetical protein
MIARIERIAEFPIGICKSQALAGILPAAGTKRGDGPGLAFEFVKYSCRTRKTQPPEENLGG